MYIESRIEQLEQTLQAQAKKIDDLITKYDPLAKYRGDYLTAKQVAEVMGVSTSTIQRHITSGRLQVNRKIRGHKKIYKSSIL